MISADRAHDHSCPKDESDLDDMIAESFPASDAPSFPSLTLGPPTLRPRRPYFLPARPLLRVLPLARRVPQRTHVAADLAIGVLLLGSALLARSRRGRLVGALLAGAGIAITATTDTTTTAAHFVPVEAHEAFDHAWGTSALLAPVLLGYASKDPFASLLQIVCGAASVGVALVTDYRTGGAHPR